MGNRHMTDAEALRHLRAISARLMQIANSTNGSFDAQGIALSADAALIEGLRAYEAKWGKAQ